MTQPGTPGATSTAARPPVQQPGGLLGGLTGRGLLGGLALGFLGAGLFGMLTGSGFLGGLAGMASIVGLLLRLGFIATPVMYPSSLATEQGLGWLIAANPFAVVIDNLRAVAIAGDWPNWELLALHGALGTAFFYGSLKYLRLVERRMVDVI